MRFNPETSIGIIRNKSSLYADVFTRIVWAIGRQSCYHRENLLKKHQGAWLMRLSWLGVVLQSKGSLVRFPVRAYAWVAGLVPGGGAQERQPIDVSFSHWCFSPSLSPSLPLSLKINKWNLGRKEGRKSVQGKQSRERKTEFWLISLSPWIQLCLNPMSFFF